MEFDLYASLAAEIHGLQHRLERLFQVSNAGSPPATWVGSAIRKGLRQALPAAFQVGWGQVFYPEGVSDEWEIILYRSDAPILFKEGDRICVHHTAVQGLIQLLPQVTDSAMFRHSLEALSRLELAPGAFRGFIGLSGKISQEKLLSQLEKLAQQHPQGIAQALAIGEAHFVSFRQLQVAVDIKRQQWESFDFSEENQVSFPALACLLDSMMHQLAATGAYPSSSRWGANSPYRRQVKVWREWIEPAQGKPLSLPLMKEAATVEADVVEPAGEIIIPKKQSRVKRTAASEARRAVAAKHQEEETSVAVKIPKKQSSRKRTANKPGKSAKPKKRTRGGRKKPTAAARATLPPLHQAVLKNDLSQIKTLLEEGANPNRKDKHGNTSLHLAAEHGLPQAAELLVALGADPNARNFVYETPLHLAAYHDSADLTQLLIHAGAEVEVRNNRACTPLHQAAEHNSKAVLQVLVETGADLFSCMEQDIQPIHLAAWYGHAEAVELLLAAGADRNAVNVDGNSALHFAAFNGQVKVIKLLINHDADPNIHNEAGETYLQGINEGYRGEMIKLLG